MVIHGTGNATHRAQKDAVSVLGAMLANVMPAANKLFYYTSATAGALTDLTSFARTLLDDTTAGAVLTTLGFDSFVQGLKGITSALLFRNAIDRGIVTLTDAATVATDCHAGNVFQVTLGGSRTLGTPTNIEPGALYTWIVTQDGTGSRGLTLAGGFVLGSGLSYTPTVTANKSDYLRGMGSPAGDAIHIFSVAKTY